MPPEFDVQAMRKICDEPWFVYPNAREALRAALDEIERLQTQQMHDCISCRSEAYNEGRNLQDKRIAELEGAAKADESRLIAAAKNAGIEYFGCDTPDHLADRALELEAALVGERAQLQIAIRNGYIIRAEGEDDMADIETARQQLRAEGKL